MKKTTHLIFLFIFLSLFSFAQETVVYLEAYYEGVAQQLDSILVEDLTTQTSVMLTELDEGTTNYEINLSKLAGIECYDEYNIALETNLPGKARVNINSYKYNDFQIQLYDISGKPVVNNKNFNSLTSNIIDIHLGKSGIYILKLITAEKVYTYKLIGDGSDNRVDISSSKDYSTDFMFKSLQTTTLNYHSGDTVRFTVFATDFHGNLVERIPENDDRYVTYLSKPCDCGTVTDYEGNVYETVQIGEQCWMRQNLNSLKYANGANAGDMPYILGSCYLGEIPWWTIDENGWAYIWEIASKRKLKSDTLPDIIQGLCPNGWHLPSDEEWMELERYLGIDESELLLFGYRGENEATKLKESGTLNWTDYKYNVESTDETGLRIIGCKYSDASQSICFWTSNVKINEDDIFPIFRRIDGNKNTIYRDFDIYQYRRLCIRCIKNKD